MRKCSLVLLAMLVVAAFAAGEEPVRPEMETLDLPPAWKGVSAQQRLLAKRAGEVDADRRLVERIYGLAVDSDTTVLDLAYVDDEIRGAVEHEIKGIRTTDVTYTDYLTVQVVRKVTVREVIETIKRTIRRTKTALGIDEDKLENISRETRDTELAALGTGAVPETRGALLVGAKRAAEMDAFRKLAATVAGEKITADVRIADLALESDRVAASLAASLKGAKVTDVKYHEDDSCEVAMRLVIRQTIERLERSCRRYIEDERITEKEWSNARRDYSDKVIEIVGNGAPRDEGAGETVPSLDGKPFYEETRIIKRVISKEVGVL